ncbi:MAG: VOC family protein [Brevundimonas sp.]|uniref:VOC family protein n=1 Tax=Brevundimonas sp. TaxID=1871086 RepID=UPI001225C21A|nr:VOC family protein [Brevundimonas sp.]RZJ16819.1 MAG: VOC family protein [Brevundimonas sp.]
MLKDKSSSAIVAVSDLGRARDFYETTLGLPLERTVSDCLLCFRTGGSLLNVYQSEFAGTNKANAVVWDCGNEVDAIVAELKGKGVTFDYFDGIDRDGDVHVSDGMRLAWFRDPDGNFLHLTGD